MANKPKNNSQGVISATDCNQAKIPSFPKGLARYNPQPNIPKVASRISAITEVSDPVNISKPVLVRQTARSSQAAIAALLIVKFTEFPAFAANA